MEKSGGNGGVKPNNHKLLTKPKSGRTSKFFEVFGLALMAVFLGEIYYLTYLNVMEYVQGEPPLTSFTTTIIEQTQDEELSPPGVSKTTPTTTTMRSLHLGYSHTEIKTEGGVTGTVDVPTIKGGYGDSPVKKILGEISLPVTLGIIGVGGLIILFIADAVKVYLSNR